MKLSIFIANRNRQELESISSTLENSRNFRIIGTSVDGKECIEKLSKLNHFNILLLDLILPEYDGHTVLEKLKTLPVTIDSIVCTSSFASDRTLGHLYANRVSEFLLKPFSDETLIEMLRRVSRKHAKIIQESSYQIFEYVKNNLSHDKSNIERRIFDALAKFNIPKHVKGYNYLKMAIEIAYLDTDFIGKVTKVIYPEIAKSYDANAGSVERAIRHSIKISWLKEIERQRTGIEDGEFNQFYRCPTNSEFISLIVTMLKVEDRESVLSIT